MIFIHVRSDSFWLGPFLAGLQVRTKVRNQTVASLERRGNARDAGLIACQLITITGRRHRWGRGEASQASQDQPSRWLGDKVTTSRRGITSREQGGPGHAERKGGCDGNKSAAAGHEAIEKASRCFVPLAGSAACLIPRGAVRKYIKQVNWPMTITLPFGYLPNRQWHKILHGLHGILQPIQ